MDDKTLWIFLHPIRSGGGTILEYLRERIPADEISFTSEVRYKFDNAKKPDKNKVRFMLGHATYYGIHTLTPNKEPRYFIFLRDPAERVISYYNAKMQEIGKKIPFDIWYKNQMKNDLTNFLDLKYKGSESTRIHTPKIFMPIVRKLNYKAFYFLQTLVSNIFKTNKKKEPKKLENAKRLLNACWFVGIIENSKKDLKFLFKEMGLKNPKWTNKGAAKKTLELDDKLKKKIYDENKLDVEIYRYALKLNKQKRHSLKK